MRSSLPDLLEVLYSFCTKFSIPVRGIIVLLVCQERPNINMPLGSFLIRCFCVVNDCDEPVAVLPNIEDYVSLHIVGIFERAANLRKIVPSNLFDDSHPCFDLGLFLQSVDAHSWHSHCLSERISLEGSLPVRRSKDRPAPGASRVDGKSGNGRSWWPS